MTVMLLHLEILKWKSEKNVNDEVHKKTILAVYLYLHAMKLLQISKRIFKFSDDLTMMYQLHGSYYQRHEFVNK
jgi:hypothetical protein